MEAEVCWKSRIENFETGIPVPEIKVIAIT